MQWKKPKNSEKYYWTEHIQEKMHYYGISQQKILGIIRAPKRIETGIALNTVAAMIPAGNIKKDGGKKEWNQEIWVLYQIREQGARNSDHEKIKKQIKKIKNKKAEHLMKLIPKKLVLISAWRYPGVSPEKDPIPSEILREIEEMKLI